MKRTFTADLLTNKGVNLCDKKKKEKYLSPKRETLRFLMQFARSYHVETNLPKELSGMALN